MINSVFPLPDPSTLSICCCLVNSQIEFNNKGCALFCALKAHHAFVCIFCPRLSEFGVVPWLDHGCSTAQQVFSQGFLWKKVLDFIK